MQDQLKDLEKERDAAASRAAAQSGTLAEKEQAFGSCGVRLLKLVRKS